MSNLLFTLFKRTALLLLVAFLLAYLYGMTVLGGFDKVPDSTPLPKLRIEKRHTVLNIQEPFIISVLGDMRWDSPPRIGILKHAQKSRPHFMVNLADVTEKARGAEWDKYIQELVKNWDNSVPYYHIPGGHSVNIRLDGISPKLYEQYFGKTYYRRDAGEWSFLFLNTFLGVIPPAEWEWLQQQATTLNNKKVVIFMHHPPYQKEDDITHALFPFQTSKLYELIKSINIQAIFAAHIHSTFSYDWHGIPVYITSLSGSSWKTKPAIYRQVEIRDGTLSTRIIEVKKPQSRQPAQ